MNPPRPPWRRWTATACKLLVVAVVLWFGWTTIVKAWDHMRTYPRPFHLGWFAASGGIYLLGLLPEGLFWYWALLAMEQAVGLSETLRAYYIGHLGKYVPGKAMVVVLRTGLLSSHRVDASIAIASVFLETLTMMSVGAAVSVPILAISYAHKPAFIVAAVLTAIAAGLPTLPPVFVWMARFLGVGRSSPIVAEKLLKLGFPTLVSGWVAMTLGWFVMGASLWAVLHALSLEADLVSNWHLYTAIVAMSVVLGFVSMIPGGFFAREAVLVGLLGPMVGGAETALVVAAAFRLAGLLAELLISIILYTGHRLVPSART